MTTMQKPRDETFHISESNMVENARIYIDKVILMDVWAAFFGSIGLGVAMVESKMYYTQVAYNVVDENDVIIYESQKSENEAIS